MSAATSRGASRALRFAVGVLSLAGACGGDRVTPPRFPADALLLRVGETRSVTLDAAAAMHVASTDATSEYTIVAFASPSGPVINLQVNADGVDVVTGPPAPDRSPASGQSRSRLTAPGLNALFTMRLQSAPSEPLETRGGVARGANATEKALSVRAMVVPAVGDAMTINVSLDACGTGTPRTGRVVKVSDHAVFVEDEGNPTGGFSAADYQSMADEYDTLIAPVLTDNFGVPSDIDDNGGRIIVFFTRAVNELTSPGSSGFTISFFYVRDLVSKVECAGSNAAELLYVMVPDPTGSINGQAWPAADVRAFIGGTLAHGGALATIQGRRRYVTQAPFELDWLSQAMGSIAEELVFYRAASLSPRHNIDGNALSPNGLTRSAFDKYQLENFPWLYKYLGAPESASPANNDVYATGAGWQFLRYLADQSTVPERTIWNSLVNSTKTGAANLAAATGLDVESAGRDWAVAQYLDDAGLSVDAKFQNPSWNFRSIFSQTTAGHAFPLKVHGLLPSTPLGITLQRGAASYWRFAVPGGQYATIHVTATGTNVANYLSLVLVRTK